MKQVLQYVLVDRDLTFYEQKKAVEALIKNRFQEIEGALGYRIFIDKFDIKFTIQASLEYDLYKQKKPNTAQIHLIVDSNNYVAYELRIIWGSEGKVLDITNP
jgi:hypothetical protein